MLKPVIGIGIAFLILSGGILGKVELRVEDSRPEVWSIYNKGN